MPIFEHNIFTDQCTDNDDNPHRHDCLFCKSKLKWADIQDIWGESDNELLLAIHNVTSEQYREVHGLEDCYLNLEFETKDEELSFEYCEVCGWWRVVKDISICAESWQIWDIILSASGMLKQLDLHDINNPVDEVATYLIAKYEDRFNVNPRMFEMIVASVFKNIGYQTLVTGYSNDGGIDVVLQDNSSSTIGVQVKRYRDKIKVEQIRAFAGSLILGGHHSGIFVCTSDFQPAALDAARKYSSRTLPITLLNAAQFYDALKIAKKNKVYPDQNTAQYYRKPSPTAFLWMGNTPE